MRPTRLRLLALTALALLLVPTSLPEARAQSEEPKAIDLEELRKERKRRGQRHPVRSRISRYLGAAAEEVDEGNAGEATRLLLKLKPGRMNPYERALVYRMLAFVAYSADDSKQAIEYFKKTLDEEILPLRDDARIRFNIAQLYAGLQEWQPVIDWLDSWLLYTENPDPIGFYLKGIAYYQLENFEQAIANAEEAVDRSAEPKESWLRLLAALFAQTEDFASATPVLEELMLRFPKKQYWVQLALIYGAREDYRRSLAVQQVAYAQGYLTEEKELERLARSYLYHDLPYPAAKVLEKAIEDGQVEASTESLELLANSWIAAREYDRSLTPLKRAADLAENGEVYVRLGQVYMQREEWKAAAANLQKAIDKGGLEDPGNAQLLLGISYYNDERVARARSSFVRARKYESTRQEANRWITHIQTESGAESSSG